MIGKVCGGGLRMEVDMKTTIYKTNIIPSGQCLCLCYTSNDCNFFPIENGLNTTTFPHIARGQECDNVFFVLFLLHPSQPVSYRNNPWGLSKTRLPRREARE